MSKNGDLLADYARTRDFWIEVSQRMAENFELEYDDFLAIAERLELVRWTDFDPAIHDPDETEWFDGEAGDPFWESVDLAIPDEWKNAYEKGS